MDAARTLRRTSSGPQAGTSTSSSDVPRPATFFITARMVFIGISSSGSAGIPPRARALWPAAGRPPGAASGRRGGGVLAGAKPGAFELAEDAHAVGVELSPGVFFDLGQRHLVRQRLP